MLSSWMSTCPQTTNDPSSGLLCSQFFSFHPFLFIFVVLTILFFLPTQQRANASPTITGRRLKITKMAIPILLPKNKKECSEFVLQHRLRPKKKHLTYPSNVKQAIKWLKQAKAEGRLFVARGEIIGKIQTFIDQNQERNLFLLFGNKHSVIQHYRFFNELLTSGKDGLALSGITHISLEAFMTDLQNNTIPARDQRWMRRIWTSSQGRNQLTSSQKKRQRVLPFLQKSQQPFLDLYLKKGSLWALRFLQIFNRFLFGSSYSDLYIQEFLHTLQFAYNYNQHHSNRPIKVVASDMSLSLRKPVKHLKCWLYSLREIISLKATRRAFDRQRRNVAMFMWGADHIRKQNFPRFISTRDQVISIRFQGGNAPDIWDRALLRLGWMHQLFAIETPMAEESDLMIHFPPSASLHVGKTWIGPLSQAHLLRRPKKRSFSRLSPFPTHYRRSIRSALNLVKQSLSYCHLNHQNTSPTLIRVTLSPSGQVQQLSLPNEKAVKHWSIECLQYLLKQVSFPRSRFRASITFDFPLAFRF